MSLVSSGVLYLWPDKPWLGYGGIGLGLLVFLLAATWEIARHFVRKEYENHHSVTGIPTQQLTQTANPRNEFNPKIEIHHNQAQAVGQAPPKRTFANPHIEFTNPFIGPREIDAWGCLRTATTSPNVEVMLARFYYKPERNVPPFLFVKAHISIANADHVPIKARYDATWDEECDSASIRLGTAETGVVVVALLPPPEHNEGESILTWGFGSNKDGFAPDTTERR